MASHESDAPLLRVGFESWNYGGSRNCYAPVDDTVHQKVRRVPFEYIKARESFGLSRIFLPLGTSQVDVLHLWNRVSVGRRPWGVSFESDLPFLNPRIHATMIKVQKRLLFTSRCKFIIAMSEHAHGRFRASLESEEWEALRHKVHRVYPTHPIPIHGSPAEPPEPTEPLRLVFTGGDFFRKGGEALLRVVEAAGEELNLQATIISNPRGEEYAGTPPRDLDVGKIKERLATNPRIDWHQSLPHGEVLLSMRSAHVGLLPTMSDTFGYVAMEMMGLGRPVVATDVQALPEFIDETTGWPINIPKADGIWLGRDPNLEVRRSLYYETVAQMATSILGILEQIRDSPNAVAEKGIAALNRHEQMFASPERSIRLEQIYRDAISSDV